ncbi:GNAT family N-acetyltransferase, partial [Salmonella enterica subsp. enterica serovar Typhimurium]|nr:GNAT family N-acetyltransferase [Salmonella enterica subsp. enterica serovar Typhimurium]
MTTKEKVKALWQLCFDDNEEFVEMYFRLRYKNEINIAIESGDEIVSALQMIP